MRLKIPDLLPGTSYFVEFQGKDANGKTSAWSRKFQIITDNYATLPQTPTAPTILSKGSSFAVNWAPVTTNVDGYTIPIVRYEIEWSDPTNTLIRYSAVVPKTISGTQISYDFSFEENAALFGSAQPTLRVRVRAVDNLENKSQWSSQVSATNPLPNPPSSIGAAGGAGTIDITWTAPNGPTDDDIVSYNLYVGGFKIWNGNATRFTYQTGTYTALTFMIKAVDIFGQESTTGPSATATASSPFIVDTTPPNNATGVSATTGYDTTRKETYIDVNWTLSTSTDVQYYVVRYGPSSTGPWNYSNAEDDVTTTRLYGLTPGAQYYLGIRANDWSGNQSAWGTITNSPITAGADTTAPPVPTGLAVAVQGSSFISTWTPVTVNDLKEYEIGVNYSGGTEVFYKTSATRFDFPFDVNKAAFGGAAKPVIQVRVRAIDFGGNASAFTTAVTGTNAAPSAPTALTSAVGANSITVGWTAPSDTDLIGYNIYMGTAANPTTKVATLDSLSYTTVATAAQYFTIKALDIFGQESAALSGGPFTPTNPFLVDTTAPSVPTALAATLSNNANGIGSRATLSWTNGSDNDRQGNIVGYKRAADSTWSSVTFAKDDTSGIIDLAYAYTAYDFRIRAYDTSGNASAWSSTLSKTAVANVAPTLPTGLSAVSTTNSIRYSWSAIADADLSNYELTVSTTSDFSSGNLVYLTGTSTSLTVSGLNPNTTYYARLRSMDNGGLSSAYTATNTTATKAYQSALTDGVAPASSPTPVVTSNIGSLTASWTPVTNNDLVTYEVHIGSTSTFTTSSSTKLAEVTGTSLVIDRDTNNQALGYVPYFIKLIAKDADGSAAAGSAGTGTPKKVASTDSSLTAGDVGAPTVGDLANTNTNVTNAQNTANSALTAANGKNKIYHSTGTPGTTANTLGDTWFQYDGNNNVVSQWRGLGGTSWIQEKIENALIANLDAAKITTGYIDVKNRVQAGSISTRLLSISDPQNYVIDFGSAVSRQDYAIGDNNYHSWSWNGPVAESNGSGAWRLYLAAGNTNNNYSGYKLGESFHVTPGDQFQYDWDYYCDNANYQISLNMVGYDTMGNVTVYDLGDRISPVASGWNHRSITVTVPANTYVLLPQIKVFPTTDNSNQTGGWYFREINIRRKYAGKLIVDGTIEGKHIKSDTALINNLYIGSGGSVQSTDYVAGSAGFKLATGGLEIRQGIVNANTIVSGTGIVNNLIINTGGSVQSSVFNSTTGFKLDANSLTINNGSVSVGTLKSGTMSGVGRITIAAGTDLMLSGGVNGGKIYSDTYNGSAAPGYYYADPNATAGFYIGADGLVIPQGKISASTLSIGGTVTANGITIGSGGALKSLNYNDTNKTGWNLYEGGLTIYNGVIKAAALDVSIGGGNLLFDSGMERPDFNYWNANSATPSKSTAKFMSGTQSMKVVATTAGGGVGIYAPFTTHGIVPQIGQKVTSSIWVNPDVTTSFSANWESYNGGTYTGGLNGTLVSCPANTWTRIGSTFTIPSGAVQVIPTFYSAGQANGTAFYFDQGQVEYGDIATNYGPKADEILPGTIQGNMVKANAIDAGVLQAGTAINQNLNVVSALVVGSASAPTSGIVRSYNYTTASAGWLINSNGDAEFNSVTVRGNIQGNSASLITGGTFTGGTIQTNNGVASVIRMTSSYLAAWNAGGTQTFYLDGTTGSQYLGGNTNIQGSAILGGTLTVSGGATVTGYIRSNNQAATSSSGASGNGWIIDSNGAYFGAGSKVTADALQIGVGGDNLLQNSSFEDPNFPVSTNGYLCTPSYPINTGVTGSRSLALQRNANGDAHFATAYNMPGSLIKGQRLMVSWYWKQTGTTTVTAVPAVQGDVGNYYGVNIISGLTQPTTSWTRTISYVDIPAGIPDTLFRLVLRPGPDGNTTDVISYDAIKIEVGNVATAYSAGTTNIGGERITTGQIISSSTVSIGINANQPLWSIPLNGNATFQGLTVRGTSIVGASGDGNASLLQSYIYSPGTSGWVIKADGTSEFNNINARGTVQSTTFTSGSTGWQINANGSAEFNNISARGTVTSNGYVAGVSGWQINQNGNVDITSGTIRAQALAVQYGKNLLPPQYAAWEWRGPWYDNGFNLYRSNCFAGTSGNPSVGERQGTQGGYQFWGQGSAGAITEVGYFTSLSDYNIVVDPGKTYIVSAYMRLNNTTTVSGFKWIFRDVNGNDTTITPYYNGVATTSFNHTDWRRYYGSFTTNGAATTFSGNLRQQFDQGASNGDVHMDAIQVERQNGNLLTPSEFSMPGSTYLAGESITTGTIISNNYAAGTAGWKIDTAGNAEFNSVSIVGPLKTNTSGARIEIINETVSDSVNGSYSAGTLKMYTKTPGYSNTPASITVTANTIGSAIYPSVTMRGPTVNGQDGGYLFIEGVASDGNSNPTSVQIYAPGYVRLMAGGSSQGIILYNNGNHSLTGNLSMTGSLSANGNVSASGTVYGNAIQSYGGLSAPGQATFGGVVQLTNPGSNPSGANVRLDTNGALRYSNGSSRKIKKNISPANLDNKAILAMQVVDYQLKDEAEAPGKWYNGFIAEDAHDLGLNKWVDYDAKGEPKGFEYAMWGVALHSVVQSQQKELDELRAIIKEMAKMMPFEIDLTDVE